MEPARRMPDKPSPVTLLKAYLERSKFADAAEWYQRGLYKSPEPVVQCMEAFVDAACSAALTSLAIPSPSSETTKAAIAKVLSGTQRSGFDSEEAEFLCDEFAKIAAMAEVTLADEIMTWLYGAELAASLKTPRDDQKILAKYCSPCSKCGASLEVQVTAEHERIPDHGWMIGLCHHCGTLNLIRLGPKIIKCRYLGMDFVQQLHLEDYDAESAQSYFENMKAAEE